MEYRIYLGPSHTNCDHLRALIEKNQDLLRAEKIHCVPPEKSNDIWDKIRTAHKEDADRKQMHATFLKHCLEGVDPENVEQLVFWFPTIKERIVDVVRAGDLLPRIRFITRVFTAFLPNDQLVFTSAVRNPAKFIVAIYSKNLKRGNKDSFDVFLDDKRPDQMEWSNTWERFLIPFGKLHPDDAPLYLWRNEDYPSNWRSVLSVITGHQDPDLFQPIEQPLQQDMSLYGAALMHHYLTEKNVSDKAEREVIFEKFLKDYPDDGTIIKSNTWTLELLTQIKQSYSDDWYFLEQMDHVITL